MFISRIAAFTSILVILSCGLVYTQQGLSEKHIDSLQKAGIGLYSEGKYNSAIVVLDSIMDTAPGSLVMYYLGLSYSAINEFRRCLIFFQRAIQADSFNIGYRFQFARNLALAGDTRKAQTQYEIIISIDSTYIPAYFQLGVLFYDNKMYDQGRKIFERLLKLSPHDFLSNYYLGIINIALGEKKTAFFNLSQCVALNNRFVPGLSALASLFFSDSVYEGSIQLYLRAIELQPDNPEFYNKASVTYARMKKNDSAYVYSLKAIELDSSNNTYLAQYGYAALLTERYEIARDVYQRVIAEEPNEPSYYMNLALAYTKLGIIDSAVNAYRQAIDKYHPENIGAVHFRLGSLFYTMKKYRQSATECRRATELDSKNREAYFFLALAYDQLKDTKNAIRNYEIYIKQVANEGTHEKDEQFIRARERVNFLKKSKQ
jgi:tetratricopeptide (TPR) repeat protein